MRPIDADELKESVLKWLPPDPCGQEEKEYPFETDICVSLLMEIEEAPTIEPRKKGTWYHGEAYPHHLYCSVCYRTALPNDEYVERWNLHMNYCPNCGARMDDDSDANTN